MFLYLIDYLGSISSSFYVFEYITLRAILSIITALVISLLIGPILIKKFSLVNISEVIRSDGARISPKNLGLQQWALLIIFSLLVSTLIWSDLNNKYVLYLIFASVSFAIIGLVDDYQKLKKDKKGISAKTKIFLQIISAGALAIVMYNFLESPQEQQLIIPFLKT